MVDITPQGILTAVLAVASAVVLISNAAEKIVKAYKAAKAPNDQQNDRLDALEAWRISVDSKMDSNSGRLGSIEESNRATQRALLALLAHGIDGNNTKQMKDAKDALENYLINR